MFTVRKFNPFICHSNTVLPPPLPQSWQLPGYNTKQISIHSLHTVWYRFCDQGESSLGVGIEIACTGPWFPPVAVDIFRREVIKNCRTFYHKPWSRQYVTFETLFWWICRSLGLALCRDRNGHQNSPHWISCHSQYQHGHQAKILRHGRHERHCAWM